LISHEFMIITEEVECSTIQWDLLADLLNGDVLLLDEDDAFSVEVEGLKRIRLILFKTKQNLKRFVNNKNKNTN